MLKNEENPLVISSELVVLCIEGDNPANKELVTILNDAKIKYKSFNVESDENTKKKLQTFSSSFPQVISFIRFDMN